MDPKDKAWIDSASYTTLLERWRNAPSGDRMFQGETGEYYAKVMRERRQANPGGHVAASKSIGWR